MKIEVKSKNIANVRDYKGKNYGEQSAAILGGGDYPLPFKVNVEQGKEYEPGIYELDVSGFGTDKHGNLLLNKVRLSRVAPTASVGK